MNMNIYYDFFILFFLFQSAFSMGGGGGMVGVTVATLPRRCHQQSMSDTQVMMVMVNLIKLMTKDKVPLFQKLGFHQKFCSASDPWGFLF